MLRPYIKIELPLRFETVSACHSEAQPKNLLF